MLTSKLIISEEVELRPGSDAGNKLKTLITEATTTTEHKGRDVERIRLHSCFLLTSNHLPSWIEAGERRFYVVDVDHEGHASGPNSEGFTMIVRAVEKALQDDEKVNGEEYAAYRFIYCVLNDVTPSFEEVVRHRCHNRRCINPSHLELGSRADNKRDDWDYWANGVDFDFL